MKCVGWLGRTAGSAAVCLLLAVGCTGDPPTAEQQAVLDGQPESATTPPTPRPGPDEPKPDPVPFVPTVPVGDAAAYDELIAELAASVPADLRSQVPWPDLRNPDPVVAQQDIFGLWIWMNENHPDPRLVELIAAPESPTRPDIVSTFAGLFSQDLLAIRRGAPYRAYDQQAITFESAGLPLWLARDVPPYSVVIYYTDESGPIETRRRLTDEVVSRTPALPPRAWLSIMVATDSGWRLWRDQIIEPGDPDLLTPNDVPSTQAGQPPPEV